MLFADQVETKTRELIASGVTEKDIAEWVAKGEDPHNLGGTSRSLYKCAIQFLERIRLAQILLGHTALGPNETYESLITQLV